MNLTKIRKLYINLTAPISFCRFAKQAIQIADAESYFPEMQRKSRAKRIVENLSWLARYKEVNDFYNLYGFDIVGFRNKKEYIDNYSFYLSRGDANKIHFPESQTCILRDKRLFYEFMKVNGFPTPEVFAVIENGIVYDLKFNILGDEFLADKKDYFIKESSGECASFVKYIADYKEYLDIKSQLKGKYIVQVALKQHPIMSMINPFAINCELPRILPLEFRKVIELQGVFLFIRSKYRELIISR